MDAGATKVTKALNSGVLGEDRNDAFKKLRQFYKARSAIVHGGSLAKYHLSEIADDGQWLLRKIWGWYFSQGTTLPGASAGIDRVIESE